MPEPLEGNAVIAVVDDDPSVRRGLQRLIRSVGWKAETFASAKEFLARARAEAPTCVVLDLQLPGPSGLDLQKAMGEIGLEISLKDPAHRPAGSRDSGVRCRTMRRWRRVTSSRVTMDSMIGEKASRVPSGCRWRG